MTDEFPDLFPFSASTLSDFGCCADFGGRPLFFATFFRAGFSAAAAEVVAENRITDDSSFLASSLFRSRSDGFAGSSPRADVFFVTSFSVVVVVVIVVVPAQEFFSREPVTSELGRSSQSKVTTSVDDLGAREEEEVDVAFGSPPFRLIMKLNTGRVSINDFCCIYTVFNMREDSLL